MYVNLTIALTKLRSSLVMKMPIYGLILFLLIGFSVQSVYSQDEQDADMILLIDEDSFNIYIPQFVAENFAHIVIHIGTERVVIEEFSAFEAYYLASYEGSLCFRFQRNSPRDGAITPLQCQNIPTPTQNLINADVFWWNDDNNSSESFRVSTNIAESDQQVCGGGEEDCPILLDDTDAVPTPDVSLTPETISSNMPFIVFVVFADNGKNSDIFKINLSDNLVSQLTETDDIIEQDPVVSPDGMNILYSSNSNGTMDIILAEVDGSIKRRVAGDENLDELSASYSPDGQYIVYEIGGNIAILNLSSADAVPEILETTSDDKEPTWSPDNSQIAYISNFRGTYDIYMLNPNDNIPQPVQLTDTMNDVRMPAWSPDGSQIVYVYENNNVSDIYVFDMDTRTSSLILNDGFQNLYPTWLDNSQIIYSSNKNGNFDLYLYDGSTSSLLSNNLDLGNEIQASLGFEQTP